MAREKRLDYPNRRKPSSKITKLIVVLLLVLTAVLLAVVTIGGWSALQGAKAVQIGYALLYVICAFFILRWRSGLLPVAAALAMILLIFAAISAPLWFQRDTTGFAPTSISASILGLLTLLVVPLQLLVMAFSLAGFRQKWQVEVERDVEEEDDEDRRPRAGVMAAPA